MAASEYQKAEAPEAKNLEVEESSFKGENEPKKIQEEQHEGMEDKENPWGDGRQEPQSLDAKALTSAICRVLQGDALNRWCFSIQ